MKEVIITIVEESEDLVFIDDSYSNDDDIPEIYDNDFEKGSKDFGMELGEEEELDDWECSKFCVTVQVSDLLLQLAEVEARPREWTPRELSVGGGWLPLERVHPHSNYFLITNAFHIFNSLSSLPSKKIANCEMVSDQF